MEIKDKTVALCWRDVAALRLYAIEQHDEEMLEWAIALGSNFTEQDVNLSDTTTEILEVPKTDKTIHAIGAALVCFEQLP